jgi:hypothetical protein
MSNAQLSPVKFHSDTIFCITHNEQPFTAMKPIVENMGLGWASQTQKLNANKERWGVTMIVIPSENGEQNMLCMPVRKLPAYMNSINPKKVRAELRAKIELYQNESDDALWKYWTDGQAVRQSAHGDTLTATEQAQLQAIVQAKAGMVPADMQRKAFAEMWTRFNRHFRIARYAQLPPAKMGEAVEYLVGMEVKAAVAALPSGKQELAESTIQARVLDQFPNDMGTGRKQALKKIEGILKDFYGLRDTVRLFTHPGGYSCGRSMSEKDQYDILLNLYRAADANLAAAYNALEAGYRMGREIGRG